MAERTVQVRALRSFRSAQYGMIRRGATFAAHETHAARMAGRRRPLVEYVNDDEVPRRVRQKLAELGLDKATEPQPQKAQEAQPGKGQEAGPANTEEPKPDTAKEEGEEGEEGTKAEALQEPPEWPHKMPPETYVRLHPEGDAAPLAKQWLEYERAKAEANAGA